MNSDGIKIPSEYSKTSACARGSPDLSVAAPQRLWAMTGYERRMQMDSAVCVPRSYLAECDQSSAHIRPVALPESENRNSLCHRRPGRSPFTHCGRPSWMKTLLFIYLYLLWDVKPSKARWRNDFCPCFPPSGIASIQFVRCHFRRCNLSGATRVLNTRGAVPTHWEAIHWSRRKIIWGWGKQQQIRGLRHYYLPQGPLPQNRKHG